MAKQEIELKWFNLNNYTNHSKLINNKHFGILLMMRSKIQKFGFIDDTTKHAAVEIFKMNNPYLTTRDGQEHFRVIPFQPNRSSITPLTEIAFLNLLWRINPKYLKNIATLSNDYTRDLNELEQTENPSKNIHVTIDLRAPKEKLITDFKNLIEDQKTKYDCAPSPKGKSDKSPNALLKTYLNNNLLAFIDLDLYRAHIKPEITDAQIGRLLFGNGYDSSTDAYKIKRLKMDAKKSLEQKIYIQFMS